MAGASRFYPQVEAAEGCCLVPRPFSLVGITTVADQAVIYISPVA
jgi:hypothetical protein